MKEKPKTGCLLCAHCQWDTYNYPEYPDHGYYYCEIRDDSEFKTFPCKRKLKCFEPKMIVCPECDGLKYIPGKPLGYGCEIIPCGTCHGTWKIEETDNEANNI